MATKTQLTGGNFQDTQGNVLANGYLTFELSQDVQANTSTEICAGYLVEIALNTGGSVDTTQPQYIWGNDVLVPAGTFYVVRAYTENGQLVWGPNAQQVTTGSGTFDVGTWVPGIVNVSGNITANILLQTDGTNNGDQNKLNLVAGSNVTITDDGNGDITFAATGGGTSLALETDGVANGSQILLNLVPGANVTITDNGTGSVTIAATSDVTSFNTRTGAITLTSGDVTAALGFTPPSVAVTSFNTRTGAVTLSSGDVVTALGFTPIANITGLVTPGVSTTVTGSGTSGSPYVVGVTNPIVLDQLVFGSVLFPNQFDGLDITSTAPADSGAGILRLYGNPAIGGGAASLEFYNKTDSSASNFSRMRWDAGFTSTTVYTFISEANGTGSIYPVHFRFGTTDTVALTTSGQLSVGTVTPDGSAVLQADSTSQGFLPPRMSTTQKNAISSPAEGLLVYDDTLHKLSIFTGSVWETVTSV